MTDFSPEESTRRLHNLYRLGLACAGSNGRVVWTRDGAPMDSLDERDPPEEEVKLLHASLEAVDTSFVSPDSRWYFDPEYIDIETGELTGPNDEVIKLVEGTSLATAWAASMAARLADEALGAKPALNSWKWAEAEMADFDQAVKQGHVVIDGEQAVREFAQATLLCCSFCGRTSKELRHLIAGPAANICSECVDRCTTITKSKSASSESTSGHVGPIDIMKALEIFNEHKIPEGSLPDRVEAVVQKWAEANARAREALLKAQEAHEKRQLAEVQRDLAELRLRRTRRIFEYAQVVLANALGSGVDLTSDDAQTMMREARAIKNQRGSTAAFGGSFHEESGRLRSAPADWKPDRVGTSTGRMSCAESNLGSSPRPMTYPTGPFVEMWETKVVLSEEANACGLEGWEPVGSDYCGSILMKRRGWKAKNTSSKSDDAGRL